MKRTILISLLTVVASLNALADNIYIMNAGGYNTANAPIVNAIIANGHTVTNNTTTFNTWPGITTSCVDPVAGYDWICFFGNNDFSPMVADIATFIDNGGKVFYQYEVSCCVTSSTSAASILSTLTGNAITPNASAYQSLSGSAGVPGWEAVDIGCCVTFLGNAYKCLDGLPANNQLEATGDLNGGSPSYAGCTNFGFVFHTSDFVSGANQGAIVGMGDINAWFDSGEPGGPNPVNAGLIDFFFPTPSSPCYLIAPGCTITGAFNQSAGAANIGNDTTLCPGQSLTLDATAPGASYLWNDNSTGATLVVTTPGTYWVDVNFGSCIGTDTIVVNPPGQIDLGPDTIICPGGNAVLDATTTGATYEWNDNSTNPTFTAFVAGTYWVEVTVAGCSSSDTVDVIMGGAPISLGNDTTICSGSFITLDATTNSATYLWSDFSSGPELIVNDSGSYWIQITVDGCVSSDTILVDTVDCSVPISPVILQMPNIFTPNSDLLNEFFTPIISVGIDQMNTKIFNRWGKLLFDTDDLLVNWDGKAPSGKPVSDGTYFWSLTYTDVNGGTGSLSGTINVTR